MQKIFKFFILLIFGLGSLSAQTFIGKVNPYPEVNILSGSSSDTLKILAVMVSFQEDKDQTTVGNGKFNSIYLNNYGNSIIDPLPHDKPYFESHLEFVKNYFTKVSGEKLHIVYNVLPDTFSVSKTMRNYSPEPGSDDLKPLGDFAVEAWTLADQLYPGFDFSSYDLFLVFHAGVGRDIILPGSLGNERDLPSVYLGERAFKKFYGSEFGGIPVSGGAYSIKNSIIMPQTQNREINTFGGTVLFEITINGLLVASVASHLGLPDLFNTETGLSAIGRFGLMDGQSIFAYNGVFPPEPSAWEKIYLGWAEPVTINPGNSDVSVVTKLAASLQDSVILKIPISSTEYFLVENRIRDARNDGAILKYVLNGETLTASFAKDTSGFLSYSIDALRGVIIDVDEFDWALPGNGIVVWHIDENVIASNIESNTINNDKSNRGVDVEEADGVQDIGERFRTIFGDFVIGEGTEDDFWFASNPSELYKNKFGKETRPSSRSNTGANSLITLSDFSEIGNRMSFRISYGDSVIKPLFSSSLPIQSSVERYITALTYNDNVSFGLVNNRSFFRINNNGEITSSIPEFSSVKPSSFYWNNSEYFIGVVNNRLNLYTIEQQVAFVNGITLTSELTSLPAITKTATEQFRILCGTIDGKIYILSPGSVPGTDPVLIDSVSIGTEFKIKKIAASDVYYSYIMNFQSETDPLEPVALYRDNTGNQFLFRDESPVDLALTKDRNGNYLSVILTNKNKLYIISGSEVLNTININSPSAVKSFILADLKLDGNNYIVLAAEDKIFAYNLSGGIADNFTFSDPNGNKFSHHIIAADFEGDARAEIIAFTEDGRIFSVDGGSGNVVAGYPITAGTDIAEVSAVFNYQKKTSLAVVNQKNDMFGWQIGSTEGNLMWSEKGGGSFSSSFAGAASSGAFVNEFFPKNRAYNYPNPVYGNSTAIRYYVSEDSRINIKIFDLAGDFVAELNDNAIGGFDNETSWNVNGIQSGVYLARIEAVSASGKTESNIIKIAIVR